MADVRATQVGVEAVLSEVPDVRTTQLGVEAVLQPAIGVRVSQVGVETTQQPAIAVRATQLIVEYIRGPQPPVLPSQLEHIRRLRQAPHISTENVRMNFRMFQLDLQAGIGLLSGQGSDPTVFLSWSDDGEAATWSNEYPQSAGAAARFDQRVIWRRLGQSRDRVFRVVVSDPVDWVLLDAYLEIEKGTS